jgi:hypothetical protein
LIKSVLQLHNVLADKLFLLQVVSSAVPSNEWDAASDWSDKVLKSESRSLKGLNRLDVVDSQEPKRFAP